jgi:hypothetical protein
LVSLLAAEAFGDIDMTELPVFTIGLSANELEPAVEDRIAGAAAVPVELGANEGIADTP